MNGILGVEEQFGNINKALGVLRTEVNCCSVFTKFSFHSPLHDSTTLERYHLGP